MLLEKEQANENERQRIYASVSDEAERQRLDKIFGIERAKASEIIRAITKEHEATLALKMEQLGLL